VQQLVTIPKPSKCKNGSRETAYSFGITSLQRSENKEQEKKPTTPAQLYIIAKTGVAY
jgi:hypothetical protein